MDSKGVHEMDIYENIEAVEMAASNLLGVVVRLNSRSMELEAPNPNCDTPDCYGEVDITTDRMENITYHVRDSRQRKLFDLKLYSDGQ